MHVSDAVLIPLVLLYVFVLATVFGSVGAWMLHRPPILRAAISTAWNVTVILSVFYLAEIVKDQTPPAWGELFGYLGLYLVIGAAAGIVARSFGLPLLRHGIVSASGSNEPAMRADAGAIATIGSDDEATRSAGLVAVGDCPHGPVATGARRRTRWALLPLTRRRVPDGLGGGESGSSAAQELA